MNNYLPIISMIIFILVACGSMIMNVYLLRYSKDKWVNTLLRAILLFTTFFFLVSIPTLFGTTIGYLVAIIPIILFISLFISYGSFLYLELLKKMLSGNKNGGKDKQ